MDGGDTMVDVMAGGMAGVEDAVGVGEGDVEGAGVADVDGTVAMAVGIREIGSVVEMVQFTTTPDMSREVDQRRGKIIGGRKCRPHQPIELVLLFPGDHACLKKSV